MNTLDDRSIPVSELVRIHDESLARQIKERIARHLEHEAEVKEAHANDCAAEGCNSDAFYLRSEARKIRDHVEEIRAIPDAELLEEEKQ